VFSDMGLGGGAGVLARRAALRRRGGGLSAGRRRRRLGRVRSGVLTAQNLKHASARYREPNLRPRRSYSASASSNASRLKSGQSSSRKTNSE
jgi:hypothetical protein